MADQRSLPASIAALAKPVPDVEIITEAVNTIRCAMERLHGVPFKTVINQDVRLVMINRDRDRRRG